MPLAGEGYFALLVNSSCFSYSSDSTTQYTPVG
jgi:hypothetical protein